MRRAAGLLLGGVADPEGRGLLLRGWEDRPLRLDTPVLPEPLAAAAAGLVRLARLSEAVGAALQDHPDPRVRRAAAVLAARAHPLLAGLEPPGG